MDLSTLERYWKYKCCVFIDFEYMCTIRIGAMLQPLMYMMFHLYYKGYIHNLSMCSFRFVPAGAWYHIIQLSFFNLTPPNLSFNTYFCAQYMSIREKGRGMTQFYDKSPYLHREIQKATWQHKNATKNFGYTTLADRLRTVSWSNISHPTGVFKPCTVDNTAFRWRNVLTLLSATCTLMHNYTKVLQ